MFSMSINYTYMFPTSYMLWTVFCRPFFMKVDSVKINQRTILFNSSSVPSMVDGVVVNVSSSLKMTMTSNICLPPWPLALCSLDCLHSNQSYHLTNYLCFLWRPSLVHMLATLYFSRIEYVLPAISTAMLVWTAKLKWGRSNHYIVF